MAKQIYSPIQLLNFDKYQPFYNPKPQDLADFIAVDNAKSTADYNEVRAAQLADQYDTEQAVKAELTARAQLGEDLSLDDYAEALSKAGAYEDAIKAKVEAQNAIYKKLDNADKLASIVKPDARSSIADMLDIPKELRDQIDFNTLGRKQGRDADGNLVMFNPDGSIAQVLQMKTRRERAGAKPKQMQFWDSASNKVVTVSGDEGYSSALNNPNFTPLKTEISKRFPNKSTFNPFDAASGNTPSAPPASVEQQIQQQFGGKKITGIRKKS